MAQLGFEPRQQQWFSARGGFASPAVSRQCLEMPLVHICAHGVCSQHVGGQGQAADIPQHTGQQRIPQPKTSIVLELRQLPSVICLPNENSCFFLIVYHNLKKNSPLQQIDIRTCKLPEISSPETMLVNVFVYIRPGLFLCGHTRMHTHTLFFHGVFPSLAYSFFKNGIMLERLILKILT